MGFHLTVFKRQLSESLSKRDSCKIGIMKTKINPTKTTTEPKQMTLTIESLNIKFWIAGSGTASIDWGDGTPAKPIHLLLLMI